MPSWCLIHWMTRDSVPNQHQRHLKSTLGDKPRPRSKLVSRGPLSNTGEKETHPGSFKEETLITWRFGAVVRSLRRGLGLSQESLAERADLHRTYISDVEGGARNVTLKSLERLARALEVSAATLLLQTGDSAMPPEVAGGLHPSGHTLKPVHGLIGSLAPMPGPKTMALAKMREVPSAAPRNAGSAAKRINCPAPIDSRVT
jgi:ribosome-binding protein aMBF1 (putative translation factor)